MKKLIVTILLISTFTCGCTNSHNNEETFSQEEILQTNQGVSEEINENSGWRINGFDYFCRMKSMAF